MSKNNVAVQTQSQSAGVGFAGLLTIAFIVLKLTGVITWSWLWVLSPIWISFALFIVIALGVAAVVIFKS